MNLHKIIKMFKISQKKINPFLFNSILFVFLFLSIQNSDSKNKVFFLDYESVEIPVSFIVGSSFIFGSFYSNILIPLISTKNE
tara:strand:- start:1880 stop:2128 length:249 start_codon:yes stop_codon:yes gene_type:complete